MDPIPFILKTAFISSTLVPCSAPHAGLTVHAPWPAGVPATDWPQQRERPEGPHLPHEELSLRVTVDSGASGAFTNSSTRSIRFDSSPHLAWLRNELGDKLILICRENFLDKSFFSESPENPKLSVRPQTKPFSPVSVRVTARARRGC